MRTTSLSLTLLGATVLACGALHPSEPASRAPHGISVATARPTPSEAPEAPARIAKRVGDFSVHLISGSFRKTPALLTERVVAEEGNCFVVEYTLEDTSGSTSLRVWIDKSTERAIRVGSLIDGVETPATIEDYEALMASASVVPDSNEGLLGTSRGTCLVGPDELSCETKSYRVMIGERTANLGVTESDALPGRDVAGEITAEDGSVIYRSELVESGNAAELDNDAYALR